ncbi:MAG: hypothetical protein LBM97_00685 [Candidatus Nomurabacteria bacterium]|jgi:tetratricopeptide (TPR) repeat protein|nr:hypothetical protein [Candidatus Nomurabacteria bacterium]
MDNNNQEQGKVFSSAGAGRFQFENASVELTPEQLAEQERLKVAAEKRRKKTKITIYAVFAGLVVVMLVIIGLLIANAVKKNEAKTAEYSPAFDAISQTEYDDIMRFVGSITDQTDDADEYYIKVAEMQKKLEDKKATDTDAYRLLLMARLKLIDENRIYIEEYEENFEKLLTLLNDEDKWAYINAAMIFYMSANYDQQALDLVELLIEHAEAIGESTKVLNVIKVKLEQQLGIDTHTDEPQEQHDEGGEENGQ